MFGLTKKTSYGLIALSHLAAEPGRLACARRMAEQYDVPLALLMNVLKELAAAGYVRSVRGAHGGYCLGRPPEQIRLGQMIDDLEGPVRRSSCLRERVPDDERCQRVDVCPTADPVHRLHRKLKDFLRGITLAELLGPDYPGPGEANAPARAGREDAADVAEAADLS